MVIVEAKQELSKAHLGCFGEPGRLIASDVDFVALTVKTECSVTMFELDELIEEFHQAAENDGIQV